MSVYKKLIFSFVVLFVLAVATGLAALPYKSQKSLTSTAQQKADKADEEQTPIADYSASESTDMAARAKRRTKSSRYDKHLPEPISPSGDELPSQKFTPWWIGLSAIPVSESDAVVRGEITDAEAYLSNDKAGVYSEFTIRLIEVLKNNKKATLTSGEAITADREGGAVRFPSGRIQQYKIRKQGIPHIGKSYVFFLKSAGSEQDYVVLTGYELRAGHVFPLDGASVEGGGKLPFDDYANSDEMTFLNLVRDVIAKSSQASLDERK